MSGAPDLRFGRREHRSRPQTYTMDAFLQIAYESIAETLPDRFVRRGRARAPKRDLDADEESDYEEVTSDLEDVDDLRGWLSSMSCKTMGLIPHETFVR
ncbi:unnamed protein product, partial [Durusdinium trenchii]